ncbi:heat-shock protein IbpA [Jannaschia pagri]|uniref:Heat-shock protein IbpA n=1 Tax=Jannaschia pagri TaxID=2829797 RepID=A0ABQ4NHQ0_9RHOB|nr:MULTISPECIES: Hsp20 family protein [unclassified Jannaschia]GIT89944.1 heat-shock protein IbpA [Jannaschia sp. AI_61]GIT93949.1 heat-shock protein IbpA [Jannaschia sp. AI_62]
MRTYDFTPLYRATVGFDRMATLLDRAMAADTATTYPPYNIEKRGDDAYRISIAVAGFAEEDLSIEVREAQLTVTARKAPRDEKTTYLHRGIAQRAFEKTFQLADHVHVTGAAHVDGMLHISLERQVPEALKPRQIAITRGGDTPALEATSETVEV